MIQTMHMGYESLRQCGVDNGDLTVEIDVSHFAHRLILCVRDIQRQIDRSVVKDQRQLVRSALHRSQLGAADRQQTFVKNHVALDDRAVIFVVQIHACQDGFGIRPDLDARRGALVPCDNGRFGGDLLWLGGRDGVVVSVGKNTIGVQTVFLTAEGFFHVNLAAAQEGRTERVLIEEIVEKPDGRFLTGYTGNYIVEREIRGDQQTLDIIETLEYLKRILR